MISIDPALIIGLGLLFCGWIFVDLFLGLVGFVTGSMAGILLIDVLGLAIESFQPTLVWYLTTALVMGGLGIILAKKIFRLLLFVAGSLACGVIKLRLDEVFSLSDQLSGGALGSFPATSWFTLLFALAGGLLLMLMERYLMIILTSLAGAALIVSGNRLDQKWLTFALFGMAIQVACYWGMTRKKKST